MIGLWHLTVILFLLLDMDEIVNSLSILNTVGIL